MIWEFDELGYDIDINFKRTIGKEATSLGAMVVWIYYEKWGAETAFLPPIEREIFETA